MLGVTVPHEMTCFVLFLLRALWAPPPAHDWLVGWLDGGESVVIAALRLLLAVAAVIWLLRRKLRPLGDLVQQAQALGAGDLSARLNVTSQDEIGELARNFNQMGEALSTMVARIRGAAHNVTSRAQALSGLASGAYEAIEQQSGEISSMAGAVRCSRKSPKVRPAPEPIMMLGGSPTSVAVPPMLEASASAMRNGMGLSPSRSQNQYWRPIRSFQATLSGVSPGSSA